MLIALSAMESVGWEDLEAKVSNYGCTTLPS
jgi:hypothetical protein